MGKIGLGVIFVVLGTRCRGCKARSARTSARTRTVCLETDSHIGEASGTAAAEEPLQDAGKADASAGCAECKEVRREVEERERQASGRGLGREMAAEEGMISRALRVPRRVSRAERDEHERTHNAYRCWCDICGKGKRNT